MCRSYFSGSDFPVSWTNEEIEEYIQSHSSTSEILDPKLLESSTQVELVKLPPPSTITGLSDYIPPIL